MFWVVKFAFCWSSLMFYEHTINCCSLISRWRRCGLGYRRCDWIIAIPQDWIVAPTMGNFPMPPRTHTVSLRLILERRVHRAPIQYTNAKLHPITVLEIEYTFFSWVALWSWLQAVSFSVHESLNRDPHPRCPSLMAARKYRRPEERSSSPKHPSNLLKPKHVLYET